MGDLTRLIHLSRMGDEQAREALARETSRRLAPDLADHWHAVSRADSTGAKTLHLAAMMPAAVWFPFGECGHPVLAATLWRLINGIGTIYPASQLLPPVANPGQIAVNLMSKKQRPRGSFHLRVWGEYRHALGVHFYYELKAILWVSTRAAGRTVDREYPIKSTKITGYGQEPPAAREFGWFHWADVFADAYKEMAATPKDRYPSARARAAEHEKIRQDLAAMSRP